MTNPPTSYTTSWDTTIHRHDLPASDLRAADEATSNASGLAEMVIAPMDGHLVGHARAMRRRCRGIEAEERGLEGLERQEIRRCWRTCRSPVTSGN